VAVKHRAVLLVFVLSLLSATVQAEERPSDVAQIAQWLHSQGRTEGPGRVWPVDPEKPEEVVSHLYSGTSGVVLFFAEAYRATGNPDYLAEAKAGADALRSRLSEILETEGPGLYTGLAGIGFVLDRLYAVSGDETYRSAVLEVVELLRGAAYEKGGGVEWNDTTDIIEGSAGIGLFLLYVDRERGVSGVESLALRAGDRLLERATPAEPGSKWAMDSEFPRLMPNFSHGTAGVAYYLARLYEETGEMRFLDAALAGGAYLKSIADVTDNACLIFHHEPEGEDLYYLGWCHGPAGTARLFYELHRLTKDPEWMHWVEMSARAIVESGIPERRTPGFWNNVSQCCGNAGVAEFLLSLHQIAKEPAYLAFARRVTDDVLTRATRDERGLRFVQAENRTQPDVLQAQTGYMQGAAGIGLLLLRLHAYAEGEAGPVALPDSPFGS
jgi:lantibiotic modifying enzyme